ncbi:hypothetical protein HGM15179_005877 [Zosterops borbonicus]|uniref:Uncharacterized protein n=1 Tax=Zosterops borbonicus TaxID=364589 RepID=A0A8K1GNL3_9PASS|nr:hypothetical protein HGM15179_005877 [Zosterops borbonicus]
MVQSVLEQGQSCLVLAREVLDSERVLQTAVCAASFPWSPGQMPYAFQELGAERGGLLKQQGSSFQEVPLVVGTLGTPGLQREQQQEEAEAGLPERGSDMRNIPPTDATLLPRR